MYNTTPSIIAPNEPNCTALILFQPKKWLSTNTIAAMTMRMIPKFFKNPFITLLFYFKSYRIKVYKETQYSPIVKVKSLKSAIFFLPLRAVYYFRMSMR